MIEDLRIRNRSEATQKTYIRQVAAFAHHFGRSPADLGPEHIRAWQVHLVEERGVCWSTLNVAVCALRFLYRTTLGKDWALDFIPFAKAEKKLPVVLRPQDVRRLLDAITNPKQHAML
jgi:site-specific recombinase XerD